MEHPNTPTSRNVKREKGDSEWNPASSIRKPDAVSVLEQVLLEQATGVTPKSDSVNEHATISDTESGDTSIKPGIKLPELCILQDKLSETEGKLVAYQRSLQDTKRKHLEKISECETIVILLILFVCLSVIGIFIAISGGFSASNLSDSYWKLSESSKSDRFYRQAAAPLMEAKFPKGRDLLSAVNPGSIFAVADGRLYPYVDVSKVGCPNYDYYDGKMVVPAAKCSQSIDAKVSHTEILLMCIVAFSCFVAWCDFKLYLLIISFWLILPMLINFHTGIMLFDYFIEYRDVGYFASLVVAVYVCVTKSSDH